MELPLNKAGPGRNKVVLLAGAPRSVEFEPVRDTLLSVPGVRATHDLHLWALTLTYHVVSAHLAIGECVNPASTSQNQPLASTAGQPGVLRWCLFESESQCVSRLPLRS